MRITFDKWRFCEKDVPVQPHGVNITPLSIGVHSVAYDPQIWTLGTGEASLLGADILGVPSGPGSPYRRGIYVDLRKVGCDEVV